MGGDQAKVAGLYRCFMDEAVTGRADATLLLARLGPVGLARTKEDLAWLMGRSIEVGSASMPSELVLIDHWTRYRADQFVHHDLVRTVVGQI